jgi:N-acetylglucosaminyldiphosphoundecaprenol N-acetyl-beta-D-mannosaminyltransferase
MKEHTILGVRVHDLSPQALREMLTAWLKGDQSKIIVTPNPEFVMYAQQDADFKHLLADADIALPDGVGLKFAIAALTNDRLEYRHTGADTLLLLAELATTHKHQLVLFGGTPRKTERAALRLREQFQNLEIAVFDPGIIDEQHVRLSEATLAGIERLAPKIVAVALGQGKQERVMAILKAKIPSIRILIGIGGASDYVSLAVRRAPTGWQRFGFEWLWRLIQEPWRWRRILTAVLFFPLRVFWSTVVQGRPLQAIGNVAQELRRHFKHVT